MSYLYEGSYLANDASTKLIIKSKKVVIILTNKIIFQKKKIIIITKFHMNILIS